MNEINLVNSEEKLNNEFYIFFKGAEYQQAPLVLDNSADKDIRIDSLMKIGEVYLNGIFPKFIVSDKRKVEVISEYHLEVERQQNFPDYPSRCSSLYAFPSKTEVNKAISTYNWGTKGSEYTHLLKVKINTSKPYKVFKGNMEEIGAMRGNNPQASPQNYWSGTYQTFQYTFPEGTKFYPPIDELVIEGELIISEVFNLGL